MTRLQSLIHYFKRKPKKLFLADGLGALLTSVLLIALLTTFNESFGMPLKAVYVLASVAFVYFIYSISCYLFLGHNWNPYLKLIAIANLFYCFATITLVVFFYQSLTSLGVIYFIAELIIIFCLLLIEFKTAFQKPG
jgi:hypothetical protein